ncbi:MAG: replication factor C small subunit [Candidatus Hadarchaeum sp.]|uniref:replication factor C small subunit n=1 Tax=Candidatus Hadarchaeum sp. TaxID=2883567 RepID=UPI0031809CA9
MAEVDEIWVEKYRPKKLDEIVGQEEIVTRLKSFVEKKSLPNLLFAGPAGTGKTTAALCIARELFGDGWRQNMLELNASDERGIDTIRTKVKDYARTRPIGDFPYKIILLDESDALTADAQNALRRTMEMFTQTTRFILDCNYSSRIIEPIQSRCAVFRFRRLTEKDIEQMFKRIAKEEKLTIAPEAVQAIAYLSEGDLRKAINILQAAAALSKKVTEKTVYEVSAAAKPEEVRQMLELALSGKFEEARTKLQELLIDRGLAGEDVIEQVHREVFNLKLPENIKVEILDKIGEFSFRLVQGANERIQLEAMLAHFGLIGEKMK